ncbi:RNA polymerase subunit sigma-32, partial [Corallococcus exercitus]|nr:RNA polymerase subunit sigma-32 [Corallococcus exercitus]
DVSLNAPLGWEGDVTRLDMLESEEDSAEELADRGAWAEKLHQSVAEAWPELDVRERALVKERMLAEDGVSAELLAKRFGVTAVRIRQIEQGLRQKLRQRLTAGCTAWDSESPRLAA